MIVSSNDHAEYNSLLFHVLRGMMSVGILHSCTPSIHFAW